MKKIYIIVLAILVLMTCLTSCDKEQGTTTTQTTDTERVEISDTNRTEEELVTQDEEIVDGAFVENFSALQYGASEASGLPTDHKNNFSYSEYDFQEEDVPFTVEITDEGTTYELTYTESSEGPLYQDTVHKYSNGTIEQWFSADSGTCVFYNKSYRPSDEGICSKEEQINIAYEFLKGQVKNPEQYVITRETYISSTGGLYIDYTRFVDGIATYDQVKIRVDKIGDITLYKLEHVNEMSNVQSIPDEIVQNAYAALENEVQSIYRQLAEQDNYEMTYQTEIDRLIRLDDGRLAFDCHVEVKINPQEGDVLTEGAWFIIPITEPTIQAE